MSAFDASSSYRIQVKFIFRPRSFQAMREGKAARVDLENALAGVVFPPPDVARFGLRMLAHKLPQCLSLVKVEPVPPAAPFVSRHCFRHCIDPPTHFGSLSFFVMLFNRAHQVGVGQLPADPRDLPGFALPAHPGGVAGRIVGDMLKKRLVHSGTGRSYGGHVS